MHLLECICDLCKRMIKAMDIGTLVSRCIVATSNFQSLPQHNKEKNTYQYDLTIWYEENKRNRNRVPICGIIDSFTAFTNHDLSLIKPSSSVATKKILLFQHERKPRSRFWEVRNSQKRVIKKKKTHEQKLLFGWGFRC